MNRIRREKGSGGHQGESAGANVACSNFMRQVNDLTFRSDAQDHALHGPDE
jgi:hypothetical protein